jgi:phosphopantetheinyl transferase
VWCAKEAYLKACGWGLRREPAEVAIDLDDRERLRIEDRRQPVPLEEAFVTRSETHQAPAILACVVLAR